MSITGGWVDGATRRAGVADKVYPQENKGLGLALHSMEGSVTGSEALFFCTDRDEDGNYTPYCQKSVTFAIGLDGELIQYYAVWASPWASGNWRANTELWPVECEGRAPEPLSVGQVATMIRLTREWEAWSGHVASRNPLGPSGKTLWEHREVWDWSAPNSGPTACPSNRYDPFYVALEVANMPGPTLEQLATELAELNAAITKRDNIRAIADGDYSKMLKAWDLLKDAGLI